ncbi:hypothetical protein SAMN04487925_1011099 [Bradyrhizobium sp. cf659]|nr:hypothetical protein SAMN04487925_1011099 [Bradyrhizobium sp. cf659]
MVAVCGAGTTHNAACGGFNVAIASAAPRPGHKTEVRAHVPSTPSLRGALATKQSRVSPWRDSGLLRCARNDGARGQHRACSTRISARRHRSASSRLISPELCFIATPSDVRGRREGRVPAGTRGPLCERWQRKSAQRHTGEAQHTAFPAQWFDGLCRALPGERCTIAPVALRIADARARLGRHITARLGAQTPGARTTRFCRTQIAPVVCAKAFAHGCPPCEALRADVTSVHRSSPRMS